MRLKQQQQQQSAASRSNRHNSATKRAAAYSSLMYGGLFFCLLFYLICAWILLHFYPTTTNNASTVSCDHTQSSSSFNVHNVAKQSPPGLRAVVSLSNDTSDTTNNDGTKPTTTSKFSSSSHEINGQSEMTFGHALLPDSEDQVFLYPVPEKVAPAHRWRYRSNGVYWTNTSDPLFQTFQDQLLQLRLRANDPGRIVPPSVQAHLQSTQDALEDAGLTKLALLWQHSYPYTLEHTTFPLADGTTYLITGDIPLMWHRDSCAQVNQYLPLLSTMKGPNPLLSLVEGLVRRQSLFILLDPYATSFRLFLDFDFAGKHELTDWDYKSGRTIHVAMHNFELDNLAYHLKLSYDLYRYSNQQTLAMDTTWLRSLDAILDLLQREQKHAESAYVYPELPQNGKGNPVCDGHGLVWCGFRPSDDATKYGYLIPSNMMMIVALRRAAQMVREIGGGSDRAARAETIANQMDEGIHQHAVIEHDEFGKIYAYEVDACGNANLMDDANIPSLLSIPYLEYTSPHDPNQQIANNTRRFVLSPSNPFYYDGDNGNRGIGSPHTPHSNVWHLAVVMEALTTTGNDSDAELLRLVELLERTAANDLMHESFSVQDPRHFTRPSFAWANSLFSELISTRLADILRVKQQKKAPQKAAVPQ